MIARLLSKLYDSTPRDLVHRAGVAIRSNGGRSSGIENQKKLTAELEERFSRYTTGTLKTVDAKTFRRHIESELGIVDSASEGYADGEVQRQRDLSVRFQWGHDHDFGAFKLEGRMGDRHIRLMANFATIFPIRLDDFQGKNVLDVGCWTGGTTLLLASLGSQVVAVEEVRKYAEMVAFMARSFGLEDRVSVKAVSLYECNTVDLHDRFDIAYFPGVIYHLSDPVVGLRILFNALKVGGTILVESAGIHREEPLCGFGGSFVYHAAGTKEQMNRGGWNWFLPSPSALDRMMHEAGFEEIQTRWVGEAGRVYGYGKKLSQAGICRAGLSVPDIR